MRLPSDLVNIMKMAGVHGICREDNHLAWDETLEALTHIPVSYSHAGIDYQLAYQRGNGGDWWDISIILHHDMRPCGVWPLSFSIKGSDVEITSQGLPVVPPLFVKELTNKARKNLVKGCLNLLREFCRACEVSKCEFAESFSGQSELGLSEWHIQCMSAGASINLRHELFVDLSLELAEIKARFRRSYKSLVVSGMRIWKTDVMTEANQELWDEFRQFHLRVAGRVTRSAETWELQYQAIVDGKAFLVYLRNDSGDMVGGGFFNITRDEGVYAVGVYDRALFDKPLGHVVQYRAIEEMKMRGLRWYRIGFRPFPSEQPEPTEKEVSIGAFKQGFASHLFLQYVFQQNTGAISVADHVVGVLV
jgi:FemAB family protein